MQVFRGDGGDVHTHWIAYTEHMDRMVEEAFRLNVKWSLQELSRGINGDGKTTPNPLFNVKVVLSDRIESSQRIQFSPSLEDMAGYVSTMSGELIGTVSVFYRLPEILARKKTKGLVSDFVIIIYMYV